MANANLLESFYNNWLLNYAIITVSNVLHVRRGNYETVHC